MSANLFTVQAYNWTLKALGKIVYSLFENSLAYDHSILDEKLTLQLWEPFSVKEKSIYYFIYKDIKVVNSK